MSENLIGRMFVGPNGARYTFEGFEMAGGGRRNAYLRDKRGKRRRVLDVGLLGGNLIVGFNRKQTWHQLSPLVPDNATEITLSRDIDYPTMWWVLTWWEGMDGHEHYLDAHPEDIVAALREAERISGRRYVDLLIERVDQAA